MIDAHAHLDFDALREDLAGVLERASASQVEAIVCAGYAPQDCDRQLDVCKRAHELGFSVYMAPGLHPWAVAELEREDDLDTSLARLEEALCKVLAENPDYLCGLGECGLDYYRVDRDDAFARDLQERAFLAQLDLANTHDLPAIVHAVQCHQDALTILREHAPARGVQMHGYSGPAEMIAPFAEIGAVFSFGTPLTWKGQKKIKAALQCAVSHDETIWMLETDAPDRPISSAKERDEHGQPCHLDQIARAAAEILEWPLERVRQVSKRNAARFFDLSHESSPDDGGSC